MLTIPITICYHIFAVILTKLCDYNIGGVVSMKQKATTAKPAKVTPPKTDGGLAKDIQRNWSLYLLVLPVVIWYLVFCYVPMTGILMSFQEFRFNINYNFFRNILRSKWVGLDQFKALFSDLYFKRALVNTLRISISSIVFCFPAPIILALLVNEIGNEKFKRVTQTFSYLPHFISLIVICGMIKDFTTDTGFISVALAKLTGTEPMNLLTDADKFLPVYIISDIWQTSGWNMIIYLAALAGIDPSLYEAAVVDGAGRWKKTLHVTIPSILPTVIIMLIMRVGQILNVSFEKILLLSNDLTIEKADVISTLVYRRGIQEQNWSFSVAVGLFNSVVNFALLMVVNKICAKTTETSLW